MTGNGIGDEGTKSISEVLKTNTTLASLNLWREEEGKEEKEKKVMCD